MLQAENDYDPELVARLAEPVLSGQADLVLGSRDLSDPELARHMPAWKRVGNRALSALQNRTLGTRLSEFHTGYRAVSPRFLATVPWVRAADDLLFDQETVIQAHRLGLRIVEITLPTRYFVRASQSGHSTAFATGCQRSGSSFAMSSTGPGWQAGRSSSAPGTPTSSIGPVMSATGSDKPQHRHPRSACPDQLRYLPPSLTGPGRCHDGHTSRVLRTTDRRPQPMGRQTPRRGVQR